MVLFGKRDLEFAPSPSHKYTGQLFMVILFHKRIMQDKKKNRLVMKLDKMRVTPEKCRKLGTQLIPILW